MKRIPCATYRLQFNREFTFRQAEGILDYLGELGITDVYASPLFEAGPESAHGYDTCSFGKINPNLGSTADFERFTDALKKHGFGMLLDVVPNHMSATLSNAWWRDVLENGRESVYARFFDVDWRPNNPALRDKVLLPVLEDRYGKVLESGKLRMTFQDGKFFITYYDRNFPVNHASVPAGAMTDSARFLNEVNGRAGDARSFDKLDALIQQQHYRLAYWKVASEEINYRRFFDVTEMVALKMELPEVFHETHGLIFEWLKAGKITGLRIDHPDGLWDPKEYLRRLQGHRPSYVVVEKILSSDEQLPNDWEVEGTTGYDFLNRANGIFVDRSKASEFDHIYREFTGDQTTFAGIVYNSRKQVLERSFQREVNALIHRLRDLSVCTRSGRDFTFSQLRHAAAEIIASFPVYRTYVSETSTEVSETDREVIRKAVIEARRRAGSEVEAAVFDFIERLLELNLTSELDEAGLKHEREFVMKFQQLSGPAMAKGLEDTAFYRFHRLISLNEVGGDPGKFGVSPEEFHALNSAMAEHWPHTLLASATHDTKRGEDVRARLNVLSEMPAEWRKAVARWSQLNRNKKTLVGNTLAPDVNDEYLLYQTLIGAWPDDANDVKSFCARIVAFMLKAAKEAKINTNWTEPNVAYEKALQDFVERVLADDGEKGFVDDARRFARRVAFFGRFNSLAQTLLKITSPGVPDCYQGSELWDLNLVDPDNRRAVDYSVRRKLLSDLKEKFGGAQGEGGELFSKLLGNSESGAMKLFLIWRALKFRGTQRELFDEGNYVPVLAQGAKREHVCVFTRAWKDRAIVVVVPRLVFGLTQGSELSPVGKGVWRDTILPLMGIQAGSLFRNVLTRETVAAVEVNGKTALNMGQVLKTFPVALLEKFKVI